MARTKKPLSEALPAAPAGAIDEGTAVHVEVMPKTQAAAAATGAVMPSRSVMVPVKHSYTAVVGVVALLIGLAAGGGGVYYYFYNQEEAQAEATAQAQQAQVAAQQAQADATASTYTDVSTNPLDTVSTNPFDN